MPEESKKEPFVPKEDRPEVKITMDTPLSELRVRDLSSIVGAQAQKNPFEAGKTSLKDFFDKEFPEVAKDFVKEAKIEKFEKNELKDFKHDKHEKHEKNEKREKREKRERRRSGPHPGLSVAGSAARESTRGPPAGPGRRPAGRRRCRRRGVR